MRVDVGNIVSFSARALADKQTILPVDICGRGNLDLRKPPKICIFFDHFPKILFLVSTVVGCNSLGGRANQARSQTCVSGLAK